jgi:hypothetical protein
VESLGRTYDHDLRTKYYTLLAKEIGGITDRHFISHITARDLSMRYYESAFDLHRWYPKLEKLTMPSVIVTGSKGQARRLVTGGGVSSSDWIQ